MNEYDTEQTPLIPDDEPWESDLDPAAPDTFPPEDTDRIQKAIEKAVDDETAALPLLPSMGEEESVGESHEKTASPAKIHRWFFTFMCMNIPIIGWIYLLYLAFNKHLTDRRDFARAYLFYKLVFFVVSAVILGILIYIGLGFLNQLLAYMEML